MLKLLKGPLLSVMTMIGEEWNKDAGADVFRGSHCPTGYSIGHPTKVYPIQKSLKSPLHIIKITEESELLYYRL